MRIHYSLARLTALNTAFCLLLFLLMYLIPDKGMAGKSALVIGGLNWLVITVVIEPRFYSAGTRSLWFDRNWLGGTLLLILLNVIMLPVLCDSLAHILVG